MPRGKPKPLIMYPSHWVQAARDAINNPGKPITAETQLSEKGMVNVRARLTSMRSGFKQFEVRDSPLQRAAENQQLVFNKVRGDGDFDWSITITYTGLVPRPSEIVEDLIEQYRKGLRSTPY